MLVLLEGLEATTPLVFKSVVQARQMSGFSKIKHGNYHQRKNEHLFSFEAIFRRWDNDSDTFQETNISHLGKGKSSSNMPY